MSAVFGPQYNGLAVFGAQESNGTGITPVTSDTSATYSVRTKVSSDTSASYAIQTAGTVTSDCAATYNIRAAVRSDVSAAYELREILVGAYWPTPAQVLSGVVYGPTGSEYTGTATGSTGPTAAEIAAAVIAALPVVQANLVQVRGQTIEGSGSETDPWGPSA